MKSDRVYGAIDLKSFYASVECRERGLDPMNTNLVVADASRTEKTICLAVSPALKTYGVPGRPRLFEVVQRVKNVNKRRSLAINGQPFEGESYLNTELKANPRLALSYIAAVPRMAYYMKYSTDIYKIYLKYIAPEDMHIYSIDEVFIDLTAYLDTYRLSPRELVMALINEVYEVTGITATAGIGTNLYLSKIAMDIEAKHMPPDENGVRIAELDEMTYRQRLWSHRPLKDFWRVGRGYAKKLEENGLYTMGDIARCSIGGANDYYNEDLLYKMFGINAELLIDHAWGWEPCTLKEIKAYKPENNSICSGQVLCCGYDYNKTRLVVAEMADLLALDLVDKGMVTDQLTLTVGYDVENLTNPEISPKYKGEITIDGYGRRIPKHSHGTANLEGHSSSSKAITKAAVDLFDRIVNSNLLIRRLSISANHVIESDKIKIVSDKGQMDLFTDYNAVAEKEENNRAEIEKEKKIQEAMLSIKKRYGKNAVLRGMSLQEGATAASRNSQIGGHKA